MFGSIWFPWRYVAVVYTFGAYRRTNRSSIALASSFSFSSLPGEKRILTISYRTHQKLLVVLIAVSDPHERVHLASVPNSWDRGCPGFGAIAIPVCQCHSLEFQPCLSALCFLCILAHPAECTTSSSNVATYVVAPSSL